ncbi:CDC42BP [Lepeophtheirus salmonis]|uniref:CDC42BP n=1 Tax=Lepeophtheirus salmonis TaxID=72036 RepID=A0A7R8HC07_LEPSM|nr:CDC42BP [Lepeophtheirus salmonis]CAF3004540.1 CDC42BP [Lepeophtheirus salmonis]
MHLPSLGLPQEPPSPGTHKQTILYYRQKDGQDSRKRQNQIFWYQQGLLAMDSVHKKCIQKTVCEEFSDQVITMIPSPNVNRNGRRIWVSHVIQRRGKLRFIGDFIVNGIISFYNRLSQKRRGTFGTRQFLGSGIVNIKNANFITKGIAFISSLIHGIPSSAIISVMDLAADVTNVMSRHGAIYPFVRAATVGYGYGNRRRDDSEGVCQQLAKKCKGWWDHLSVINKYDGGTLPRVNADQSQNFERSSGVLNSEDPIIWNQIKVKDLSSPKVFLCKAGKFLEKFSTKMGAKEIVKERFEVEILDLARSSKSDNESAEDLPIVVFEGLSDPKVDETEIDFIERLLNSSLGLPPSSVRNAIRLPLRHGERDIILVEMDSEENEMIVLKEKQNVKIKEGNKDLGIRKAKFKELWRYVEDLLAIKSYVISDNLRDKEEEISIEVE